MITVMTMNEDVIEVEIYWYIDPDTGKKVIDEDEMRAEFELKIQELLNQVEDEEED